MLALASCGVRGRGLTENWIANCLRPYLLKIKIRKRPKLLCIISVFLLINNLLHNTDLIWAGREQLVYWPYLVWVVPSFVSFVLYQLLVAGMMFFKKKTTKTSDRLLFKTTSPQSFVLWLQPSTKFHTYIIRQNPNLSI